jgi:hypothetical protein
MKTKVTTNLSFTAVAASMAAASLSACAAAPSVKLHRRIANTEPTYHYSEAQVTIQDAIRRQFKLESWVFISGEDGAGTPLGAASGIVTQNQLSCIQLQISELRQVFQDKSLLKYIRSKDARIRIHLDSEVMPEAPKLEAQFDDENLYLWPLVDTFNTGSLKCKVNPAASIRIKLLSNMVEKGETLFEQVHSPATTDSSSVKRVKLRY